MGKLKQAKLEELEEIQDIGPIVAKSIYNWFREQRNKEFLEKLSKLIMIKRQESGTKKLSGKTFILTGGLESMTRDEAKQRIRKLGGEISESVSKDINFVIVGSEPGSKYKKAQKLGIKIIKEQEFLNLIR